ncbi:MAG: GIY-YIG nuclease family protein [Chromatiaceae bacterium]|nr:GIY-YIG nuclease family protein [Chromatiaceae bacterium]
MWYLYIVRCCDGSLYTGISTDVARRFALHARDRGARRLRGRGPLELVYSRAIGDRSLAARAEYRVKRLCRGDKELLVAGEIQLPV